MPALALESAQYAYRGRLPLSQLREACRELAAARRCAKVGFQQVRGSGVERVEESAGQRREDRTPTQQAEQ